MFQVCAKLQNGWTAEWHDEHMVPYAYGDGEWVGYDNERSFEIKVSLGTPSKIHLICTM